MTSPPSSLSENESEHLFALIQTLKARGVTMIYVTHRMTEVFRLADRVSVLRDGRHVGTLDRKDATQDSIVQMMIGRPLSEYFPHHLEAQPGPVVLDVMELSSPGKFEDITFQVRAGEIVGLAGLVGSGRSEVAKAIFGLDPRAAAPWPWRGGPCPWAACTRRCGGAWPWCPRTGSARAWSSGSRGASTSRWPSWTG